MMRVVIMAVRRMRGRRAARRAGDGGEAERDERRAEKEEDDAESEGHVASSSALPGDTVRLRPSRRPLRGLLRVRRKKAPHPP